MIRKHVNGDIVTVTFILPSDHPNAPVSVVGEMNEWNPSRHPLVRRGDGTMTTTVLAKPHTCLHFRYLGRDGVWFDEPDADTVTDLGSYLYV